MLKILFISLASENGFGSALVWVNDSGVFILGELFL